MSIVCLLLKEMCFAAIRRLINSWETGICLGWVDAWMVLKAIILLTPSADADPMNNVWDPFLQRPLVRTEKFNLLSY